MKNAVKITGLEGSTNYVLLILITLILLNIKGDQLNPFYG